MPDDVESEAAAGADKGGIRDTLRDVALSGLAAIFMGEDAVRKYVKELKLPKELVGILLENISKKKDDFYGLLAKEVGQVMSKVDLGKEISNFLRQHRIDMQLKVSFESKDPVGEKPNV